MNYSRPRAADTAAETIAIHADADGRLPLGVCWAIWFALSAVLWRLLLTPFIG